jgi:lipopolysaccharide transport system ATP-binding protein
MSDIAIRVENLGKKYHIGGKQERYSTLRDSLVQGISAPFKRIGGLLRGEAAAASDLSEEIWALKDVSFDIKHGDVVGIIGRNGAGKSTLLKILSQITEPTTGRAEIYGRVGALLEVGTGFHPELTGRENIFLNGAILGMRRKEMERKFDEIVDFSGVEKFIDTPVKHYSSGMQMRLAFAVAAHLEPEILIVDEVLAVGDAEFQKKCMGKMGEVAKGGRTVLFVSHNLGAVRELCETCVFLESGYIKDFGVTLNILPIYASSMGNSTYEFVASNKLKPTQFLSIKIDEIIDESVLIVSVIFKVEMPSSIALDVRFKDILGIPIGIGTFGTTNPNAMLKCTSGLNFF